VRLGEVLQPPLDLRGRRLEAEARNQDPGEPEMLTVAEPVLWKPPRIERAEKRRVGRVGLRGHAAWERRSIGS
jgi:hypothetical protein